jgi:hypothetical protein
MDRISNYLQIQMVTDLVLEEYLNVLKKYSYAELTVGVTDMLGSLTSIGKYVRMPLSADIKLAIQNAMKPKYFEAEEFVRDQDYSKDLLALAEKFRPAKDKDMPKTRYELYTEKAKDGLIYSHKLMKWVDKSLETNIGGTFVFPEIELGKIIESAKSELNSVNG